MFNDCPTAEDGNVPTARNNNPHRLFGTLFLKVLLETFSQETCIAPDNIVFTGVIVVRAVEYLCTDALLCNLVSQTQQLLLTDKHQELRKKL